MLVACGKSDVPRMDSLALSVVGTFYPAFDPSVYHYAADCGGGAPITLSVQSNDRDSRIFINGDMAGRGNVSKTLVGVSDDNDLLVEILNGGRKEAYTIHCLSDDLPEIEILQNEDDASDDLLLVAPRFSEDGESKTYLLILDNNGVPRFRRKIDAAATDFKRHLDGRYSYIVSVGRNDFNHRDNEVVLLDANLQELRRVKTVALTQTDNHDFLISNDGNFLFISYDSRRRDMSDFGLAVDELTRDSVIQEVTPDGEIVFEWNSWDHLDIADCQIHRFPDDYAHLNSLQIAPDGNLVASFRGCAQVLKIDRITGGVIWHLGGTNPTFNIVGDTYEEFCGQHAAAELEGGSVVMFDNGGHCLGEREALFGQFSRGVEYQLDAQANQAIFKKDYSLFDSYQEFTSSGGSVSVLQNGNWLLNWGSGPDMSLTEVSTEGVVLFQMRLVKNESIARTYRAYREPDLNLPINLP